jgi:hypothetical protein
MQPELYDQDIDAWAIQSARMVREGRLDELDLEHIAEELELVEQRKRIARLLPDSPSLEPQLPALPPDAYDSALRLAADETGLEETDFPAVCPYTAEQAMDQGFFPEA